MDLTDIASKYGKWIIFAGLAYPSIYIFAKMYEAGGLLGNMLLPIGVATIAMILFNGNFVNVDEVKQKRQVGPREPYIPDSAEKWVMDRDGRYVKKVYEPPHMSGFGPPPEFKEFKR